MAPLHLGFSRHGHVVAQIIEAKLVVGSVSYVGRVLGPFHSGVALAGDHQTDAQPHPTVDLPHPLSVATGQVVVDGDHMDALAGDPIEVNRQCGGEGLALTGLHFGHPSEVERSATH